MEYNQNMATIESAKPFHFDPNKDNDKDKDFMKTFRTIITRPRIRSFRFPSMTKRYRKEFLFIITVLKNLLKS